MRLKDEKKLASIHQAVVTLSGQVGLVGLSMSAIAAEAGIATGTLYVYYPSKEALLRDIYWEIKRATAVSYFDALDASTPLKTRLRTVWLNALNHRRTHLAEAVFTEQYYQSGFIDETGRSETVRLFAPFFDLVEEGKRQLIFKPIDPMLFAAFVIGPIIELARLESSDSLKIIPELQENAWQLTWDALKN